MFNVAGQEVLSIKQQGILMGSILKMDPLFTIEDKEPHRWVADTSKMNQFLYISKISMKNGISSLILDTPIKAKEIISWLLYAIKLHPSRGKADENIFGDF